MNRVIICGAGPRGLTAALLLQRERVPVLLCEAQKAPPADRRASTFHALDIFDWLGVTELLLSEGLISRTWQVSSYTRQTTISRARRPLQLKRLGLGAES